MNLKEVIKSTVIDYLKEDFNPNDDMIDILKNCKVYKIYKGNEEDRNIFQAKTQEKMIQEFEQSDTNTFVVVFTKGNLTKSYLFA